MILYVPIKCHLLVFVLAGDSEAHVDDGLRDDDLDDAFALEAERKSEKKLMSIILTNLHVNYEGWRAELPQEEESKAVEDEAGEGEKDELDAGEASEDTVS